MIRTENQIERDFFIIVKDSPLAQAISGSVYRRNQRPDNATSEDCTVKFLGGVDDELQAGTVLINVYVPYIPYADGRKSEDLERIGELEEIALQWVDSLTPNDYIISTETSATSYALDDINQSVIAIRLKFRRYNQTN